MKNKVIVAFKNDKISNTIIKMLKAGGITADVKCRSGAEVKKQASYCSGGILICGYSLTDTSIVSLIEDIPESFSVILIGSYSQIDLCESERVFKLAAPLSKSDLVYSVTMLMNMDLKYTGSEHMRDSSEAALIEEAKRLLIDKYNMSEQQAHRYMQKKSMNTGIKLSEIAKIILN